MGWSYLDGDRPFGFAHRGGSGPAPENTRAAFANAVSLGYRYLETDVHRTADGVLVAFHDGDLDRVAGIPGAIKDHPWSELAEIELEGGHRIPTLSELLEEFPEAKFNIDPKADDAVDPLIDAIRRHDAVHRVCVGSFSDSRIRRVRRALGPDLCTSPGPLGALAVLVAARLGLGWQPPYGCLQVPPGRYGLRLDSAKLIGRIHGLGLQVHFWTINDAEEMERLLDLGADAIITDEVEVLRNVLAARGHTV